MNLWRLEWLRLARTRRVVAIIGVYVFFGFTGPLTARYLSAILARLGTGSVRVEFPSPVPADGIAQFVSNAAQIGLLVVVMVSASALAFDARREMAVFLRTRVSGVRAIIVPAFTMNAVAAIVGFTMGSLAAWYETAVLLGAVPASAMLAGILAGDLFLAFAVAAVAFVASAVRSTLATGGIALVLLLGLALIGQIAPAQRWLPTYLVGAMASLVRGGTVAEFLPAAAITAALGTGLVAAAIGLGSRREL